MVELTGNEVRWTAMTNQGGFGRMKKVSSQLFIIGSASVVRILIFVSTLRVPQ